MFSAHCLHAVYIRRPLGFSRQAHPSSASLDNLAVILGSRKLLESDLELFIAGSSPVLIMS